MRASVSRPRSTSPLTHPRLVSSLRPGALLLPCLVCFLLPHYARCDEPLHAVQVVLRDVLGKPRAARVTVIDAKGVPRIAEGHATRTLTQGEKYFYAYDSFVLKVPTGRTQLRLSGGLELLPLEVFLDVAGPQRVVLSPQRWVNMGVRQWFSGDSHVHLHTGGPLRVTIEEALIAAQAEGVNYVNLCVSNNVGDDIRDAELITGTPHPISDAGHLLVFGEEMRSMIYGHMQFFGIQRLVEPQYTGFENTPNHLDFPANYTMAKEATEQGGLVTYGHPMFIDEPLPYGPDPTAANAAARELPIDAILGVAHAIDLMSYNSDETLSTELWYRLLNCGIRLAASVGTDALLDQDTNPLGGDRVYVKTNGDLSMENWLEGLRQGRSFVTNGPMLSLQVNGKGPGSTLDIDANEELVIHGSVESRLPFTEVELIVDGTVTWTQTELPASEGIPQVYHFSTVQPVKASSWIALRVRGPNHTSLFDGPLWAHTSPVFVHVGGRPIRNAEDASYFVGWIDQLLRVVQTRDRYPSRPDRESVEAIFRQARERFQERMKE